MSTLIKYLPLMIGDIIVEDDEVWEWFLLLRKLADILLCSKLCVGMQVKLINTIESYSNLRTELFPSETFKIKHHLIDKHYANSVQKVGPFRQVSCMHMKAKHRVLKSYMTNSRNCKNVFVIR